MIFVWLAKKHSKAVLPSLGGEFYLLGKEGWKHG